MPILYDESYLPKPVSDDMVTVVTDRENNNIANVSLAQIKASIGLFDDDRDDDLLLSYLNTAYELAETYLDYPINPVTRSWNLKNTDTITIEHSAMTVLRNITVKYYDEQSSIMGTTEFSLDATDPVGTKVIFGFDNYDRILQFPITVSFVEHIAIANMTASLNSAILLIVRSLYDSIPGEEISVAARRLLDGLTEHYI